MNPAALRKLFEEVRKGRLSADQAVDQLRHLPFEDLGFAKVDHHRALRQGMPEVIFSQGKTPKQVAGIFSRLAQHGGNVLATRATEEQYCRRSRPESTKPNTARWPAPSSLSATASATEKV